MARLIRADGSESMLRPNAHSLKWTLQELQTAIGGDIQIIRRGKRRMIVDGDGRLRQRPINTEASRLLRQWAAEVNLNGTVDLAGDVLVLDPDEHM